MLGLDSEALWYLTRGTGLVSIILLTIVVVLGIAQVRQWTAPGWPQFVVTGLHRNASLLAVVFLGVHIASAIVDGFAPIDWMAAVVPFESPYRGLWLGLGALAFDLVLALVITSLLRRHLSYRVWSFVHWSAYACWPLALVHGLGTGSDGTAAWVQVVYALSLAAVVAAIAWRVLGDRRSRVSARLLSGLAGSVVVVGVVVWALTGPTQPGWAGRAGTPSDLLAGPDPTAPAGPPPTDGAATGPTAPTPTAANPPASRAASFTATFTGTVTRSRSGEDAESAVTIEGTLSDSVMGSLRLEIDGTAEDNGGVVMQSSQVTMGSTSAPTQFRGTVTSLRGSDVRATVSDGHTALDLTISLTIDQTHGTAVGSVTAQPGSTATPGGRTSTR